MSLGTGQSCGRDNLLRMYIYTIAAKVGMEACLAPRLSCVGPGWRLKWTHCVISSAMTQF